MRLFVAVNFDEKFKIKIARLIGELQKFSERGNFTRMQNLHLTLQFIGDIQNVSEATEAVADVNFESFYLTFDIFTGFKRQGSEICYLGATDKTAITSLAASVGTALKRRSFVIEERPFVAHLTLGREVVFKKAYETERWFFPQTFPSQSIKSAL